MVRRGLTGERLSALFLLGLALLLPPLISVFDKPILIGGIPLFYLYLFAAWVMLIAMAALVVEWPAAEDDVMDGEPGPTGADADGSTNSNSPGMSGA